MPEVNSSNQTNNTIKNGVMLNAYPDSIGSNLRDIITILEMPEFKEVFSLFYILPTFFNSDLDRGFSIIDYNINKELVSQKDIKALEALGIQLKFDIVLNHLSVASPQFQDLLEHGDNSKYKDFFINWNTFWEANGTMGDDGVIIPNQTHLNKLFMRKSGLPILKVPFNDGTERPYWNTFYQKITEDPVTKQRTYLGQMDVNGKSPLVWKFYDEVLTKVSHYGCKLLRLDAFAYLHKEVGETNFFNKPGTWHYLKRINTIAESKNLMLLPEIHAEYGLHLHDEVAAQGYYIYDFFLPGLLIHAIEKATNKSLIKWAKEIVENKYKTVNMLGCHDGIPVLDLKGKKVDGVYNQGLLEDEEIDEMIQTILKRGGRVKNLYGPDGKKVSYYQVNATYFSALGEDESKLLLARAIQLFMPGIPQIWYLDIFAGKNDHDAADKAGAGGHKEINRTTLSISDIKQGLEKDIVKKQLKLIKLRNTHQAFFGSVAFTDTPKHIVDIKWTNNNEVAHLKADLKSLNFVVDFTQDNEFKKLH